MTTPTTISIDGTYKIEQRDALDFLSRLEPGSVDLILTDPPYGMTANGWDKDIQPEAFLDAAFKALSTEGNIVSFAMGRFSAALITAAGNTYRYSLVWAKTQPTGHLNARRRPLSAHEDILVFSRVGWPMYTPIMTQGHPRKVSTEKHKRGSAKTTNYGAHGLTSYDSTERYPTSVLTGAKDTQKMALAPTQKPEWLMERLIQMYSPMGGVVVDPFAGSGTTGVAAMRWGRRFMGGDIDARYVEMARKRLQYEAMRGDAKGASNE